MRRAVRPPILVVLACCGLLAAEVLAQHPFAPSTGVGMTMSVHSVVTLDIGADGDLDIVAGGPAFSLEIAVRQGGGYQPGAALVIPAGSDRLRVGDLTGDGAPEIVARALSGGSASGVHLVANMGSAGLAVVGRHAVAPDLAAFELADLDLDADLDLVFLATLGGQAGALAVAWNDGTGSFGAPQSLLAPVWASARDLAVADLDRDGDPDVVLLPQSGTQGLVWINDGTGAAAGVAPFSLDPAVHQATRMVVGDLDGDGLGDLVVGHALPNGGGLGWLRLHRGIGGGSLGGPEPVANPGGLAPEAMVLCDCDQDGDLDLVVLTQLVGALLLGWNDGTGSFPGVVTLSNLQPGARALLAADLDADGDPDLVRGRAGGIADGLDLLDNLSPRLSLLSAPLVGTSIGLAVSSPKDVASTYMCGFSLLADPGMPLPDGRKIPLHPDPLFSFCFTSGNGVFHDNVGTLDATGLATVQLTIPAEPNLVGWTFHAGVVTLLPGTFGGGIGNVNGQALSFTLQ